MTVCYCTCLLEKKHDSTFWNWNRRNRKILFKRQQSYLKCLCLIKVGFTPEVCVVHSRHTAQDAVGNIHCLFIFIPPQPEHGVLQGQGQDRGLLSAAWGQTRREPTGCGDWLCRCGGTPARWTEPSKQCSLTSNSPPAPLPSLRLHWQPVPRHGECPPDPLTPQGRASGRGRMTFWTTLRGLMLLRRLLPTNWWCHWGRIRASYLQLFSKIVENIWGGHDNGPTRLLSILFFCIYSSILFAFNL